LPPPVVVIVIIITGVQRSDHASSQGKPPIPAKLFTSGIEFADPDAPIWRFMNLQKFKDLVSTRELLFNRADRSSKDRVRNDPRCGCQKPSRRSVPPSTGQHATGG